MAHVTAFSHHFRALQDWGAREGAELTMDVARFQLEVKCRGRYFRFFPQFFGRVGERFGNTEAITPDTRGFAGWLPYRPYEFALARDKRQFKAFCEQQRLATPDWWPHDVAATPPPVPFLLKRSAGSYGLELAGPFHAGAWPASGLAPIEQGQGEVFAETFVEGEILKLWCWGARAFHAHVRPFSRVRGDGVTPARELVQARLQAAGQEPPGASALGVMDACLRFQGFSLDEVLPAECEPFIDYRYGRDHAGPSVGGVPDNALGGLPTAVRGQLDAAARAVAGALQSQLPAPVLYSLDGVIAGGQVHWLELNSNPVLPPEGYAPMFADLFGA